MNAHADPLFVKRDLDGFFGLLIDNLVQLLVIAQLTELTCGFDRELIYGRILPAAALSIIFGNVYYTLQARALARRENRTDVTALPYGINTPSVFAFILFIMAPIYQSHRAELGDEAAARLAWQVGLVACMVSGLMEFGGAFIAERIRRVTPRAALLSALAGIAIGFISMDFVLQVFEHPLLALLPMGIILMQYFSGVRLPLGLPAGLWALIVGAILGWGIWFLTRLPVFESFSPLVQMQLQLEIGSMPAGREAFFEALRPVLALPVPALNDLFAALRGSNLTLVLGYLGVIIPMGLFNLVGSLQNIESAEAAGDSYAAKPALAVNGVGSMVGAAFGSCFPTTIYIGHVGWKMLGARSGYSLMNGLVIAFLCLTGLIRSIEALIPIESVIGILLWIAIVITAQAYQAVPRRHAPAVAMGIIPGIAAWGLLLFNHGLGSAGQSLAAIGVDGALPQAHVGGLIGLDRGFILTSMCLSAMGVMMIERRLGAAAIWAWILAGLSFLGVIHAWNPLDVAEPYALGFGTGWNFAVGYALWGGALFMLRGRVEPEPIAPAEEK